MMDYDNSDTSGTDDDIRPSNSGRIVRGGRMSGNGRTSSGPTYGWMTAEQQIQKLEQDAYTAVLRAFIAQSEHITWAKEGLMSDLRKELRVSDEQHREFLGKVRTDVTLRQIRELRISGDEPMPAPLLSDAGLSPPTVLASRKKQKTAPLSQPLPTPSATTTTTSKPALIPSSAAVSAKKPTLLNSRSRKSKNGRQQCSTTGVPGGRLIPTSTSRGAMEVPMDPWIGRRVKTRWPEDNTFYEAVITDYDPEKGLHALTYGMNTEEEAWEWVNLKELSSRDLKWVDAPPVEVISKVPPVGRSGGTGRGIKKGSVVHAGLLSPPAAGVRVNSFKKFHTPVGAPRTWRASGPSEKGLLINGLRQIRLSPIEALIKEVDKAAEEDDLAKLESTKKTAMEREEMIREALAEIGQFSDGGESDREGNQLSLQMHERERSRQDSRGHLGEEDEDDTAGDGRVPMAGEGLASDEDDRHQEAEEGDYDHDDG